MTTLQKPIEDIKDTLASIEGNGERRVGEAKRLLARLAALENNWLGSSAHYPRTMTGELGDKRELLQTRKCSWLKAASIGA